MIYGIELIMSITYVFSDDLRRKRETRTVLEDDPGDDVEVTSPEPSNTYTSISIAYTILLPCRKALVKQMQVYLILDVVHLPTDGLQPEDRVPVEVWCFLEGHKQGWACS